eukprot:TRINITY_DN1778_c0_g1_i1.p1 TRINITY_DN1778_c0_g1~~TRINITY_DN1778_c0_g1_i1.p1  ORF type:complete len:112 (-),score=17.98 TRINITY_DN1778_c0_g1_i1:23-358(-)
MELFSECFELVKRTNELQKRIYQLLEPTLGEDAAVAMGSMVQRYTCRAVQGDGTLDKQNEVHRLAREVGECLVQFIEKSKALAEEDRALSWRLQEEVTAYAAINDPKVYQI